MQIVTAADRPDLDTEAGAAFREKWPEFIFHDDVAAQYAPRVETLLLPLQHLRPRRRRGRGRRRVGRAAVLGRHRRGPPRRVRRRPGPLGRRARGGPRVHDAQLHGGRREALARPSGPGHRGAEELTRRAVEDGLTHVSLRFDPPGSTATRRYSMAEYASWVREDGLSVDPWIRTHQRMGARVLAPRGAPWVIEGSVAQWEAWADTPAAQRTDDFARYVITLATWATCSRPWRSYTYWITSSRRSLSMSMSMSGGPSRSGDKNRSNSRPSDTASALVMPSA